MSLKLSVVPMDKGENPPSGPPSLDDESRQICQGFRNENYEMDEVAQAVCHGGLSEGYQAFLKKFKDYPLPATPRSGIDAPESDECAERKERFDKAYLAHLRRVRASPFKATRATAFLDLKEEEGLKHGFKCRS